MLIVTRIVLFFTVYCMYVILLDSGTYSWIFNSITRLIALIGYFPENVHSQVALHFASENIDIQQVEIITSAIYTIFSVAVNCFNFLETCK